MVHDVLFQRFVFGFIHHGEDVGYWVETHSVEGVAHSGSLFLNTVLPPTRRLGRVRQRQVCVREVCESQGAIHAPSLLYAETLVKSATRARSRWPAFHSSGPRLLGLSGHPGTSAAGNPGNCHPAPLSHSRLVPPSPHRLVRESRTAHRSHRPAWVWRQSHAGTALGHTGISSHAVSRHSARHGFRLRLSSLVSQSRVRRF